MLPASARAATGAAGELYKDPRAPVDLRVRDLLSRMTLEEKVAQLITLSRTKRDVMDDELRFDPAKADAAYHNGIGQVARPSDRGGAATATNVTQAANPTGRWRPPADTIAFVNAMQAGYFVGSLIGGAALAGGGYGALGVAMGASLAASAALLSRSEGNERSFGRFTARVREPQPALKALR